MTWGSGKWGESTPWGTGLTLPPPVLSAISPAIVARRGGDVIKVVGENFFDPITIEVLKGLAVVGTCYVFDAELDLERNRVFTGTPALADGFYSLRVTTDGGESNILVNVLEYRLFSEEVKTHRVRIGFAAPWVTGPRLLTNPTTGL
jgi:hypothetical protein